MATMAYQSVQPSKSTFDAIENKVRAHVHATRVRMIDSFHDFDKLRKGVVTPTQFRRCLGHCVQNSHNISYITEPEYEALIKKYDLNKTGMVHYTPFIDSIEKVFGLQNLEKIPRQRVPLQQDVLLDTRGALSPRSETKITEIIERVRQYVRHHGSDVKSWYRDFDKHNSGYVTFNQYRRGFPPNLLPAEDINLLMSQYSDDATQTVNYFKINNHVNRKGRKLPIDHSQLVAKLRHDEVPYYPVGTENLLHSSCQDEKPYPDTEEVESKIKREVYKKRIHLMDFFRDYDRHANGLVSENQFRAGIKLANLSLTQRETNALVLAYRSTDNRVYYQRFCASIDTIFTLKGLEQNPTMEVHPCSPSYLYQGTNGLSSEEEIRYRDIISSIRTEIETRRIVLLPYFKDCSTGYTTYSHFSRLLSMLNLSLPDSDLHLLFKKYLDHQRGLINYKAFIKAVDVPADVIPKSATTHQHPTTETPSNYASGKDTDNVDVDELISRIQFRVSTHRTRVCDFFCDFDKLRLGSIKREEFVRAVNRMGFTLAEEEYEALAQRYVDPAKPDCCKWRNFERDIDVAFGPDHLESTPRAVPLAQHVPITNASQNDLLSPTEEAALSSIISRLREHTRMRQCRVKDCFREYDHLATMNFRVSPLQLKQCLVQLKMQLTEDEIDLLMKKWSDSDGHFRYQRFADAVEPSDAETVAPQEALPQLYAYHPPQRANINQLIARLKTKVKTERIRVIDALRDFDPLRHGRITKNDFRRALKTNSFQLNESELEILERQFAASSSDGFVNYIAFSDELESAFTCKGLESDPLREPDIFQPYRDPTEFSRSNNQSEERKIKGIRV